MKFLYTSSFDRDITHTIIEADNIEQLVPVIVNELRDTIGDKEFDPEDESTYGNAGLKEDDWDLTVYNDSIYAWYNGHNCGFDWADWEIEQLDKITTKTVKELLAS